MALHQIKGTDLILVLKILLQKKRQKYNQDRCVVFVGYKKFRGINIITVN